MRGALVAPGAGRCRPTIRYVRITDTKGSVLFYASPTSTTAPLNAPIVTRQACGAKSAKSC